MGGRLDATNIVDPMLSVITDISLDHQEWLGSTITLIAGEKAGILRRSGILVTLPQHPEANQALGEAATELDVRAINAADYLPAARLSDPGGSYSLEVMGQHVQADSPLKGVHQHRNVALAVAAAVELAQHHGFCITPDAIERGIRATSWPGRLERIRLPGQPEYMLDVAHNPAGAWALRAALSSTADGTARSEGNGGENAESHPRPAKCLIFACLRDKPLREMTQILFPLFEHVVLAPIHSPRATDLDDLMAAAQLTGVPSTPASTVAEALEIARSLNPAQIVISGSVYLVGEARTLLLKSSEAVQGGG
jgi:dihydrofolate synthase/folylpolyglutamate synthase